MNSQITSACTAFADEHCIGTGTIEEVALLTKRFIDKGANINVLIFSDENSEVIEIDFRGTEADVALRLKETWKSADKVAEPKGPGRPKLGVVAREVTLLPTHWKWLNSQPGGASVALRKLVEVAKKTNSEKDRLRLAQESTYRFMSAIAGNFSGFEEATRALFAGRRDDFEANISTWPNDICQHALKLSRECFAPASLTESSPGGK